MQGGTLSDEFPGKPKALFVFEGLLAECAAPKIEARAVKWGRFRRALDMWAFNTVALSFLRHFNDRYEKNFDIVTWHPAGFAEVLTERLDDQGVHPQRVFADRFDLLQMDVAMGHDYDIVFDPDPRHVHSYGHKCRHASYRDFHISL